jgi:protein-S-isoprenylcysteine O-methyltransferase Ste14
LAAKTAFYGVIICWWLFALTFWLRKPPQRAKEAKRDLTSYFGLALQSVGYFIVWFHPLRHRGISLVESGPEWFSWLMAVLAIAIAASSALLVNVAARRLGKQWSLGARVVEGHDLIQDGPYAFVRNPIYTGMLGMLVATGLVVGRWIPLLAAIAIFMLGTVVRIRSEEKLLRGVFGEKFDDYARRVWAVIPGIY